MWQRAKGTYLKIVEWKHIFVILRHPEELQVQFLALDVTQKEGQTLAFIVIDRTSWGFSESPLSKSCFVNRIPYIATQRKDTVPPHKSNNVGVKHVLLRLPSKVDGNLKSNLLTIEKVDMAVQAMNMSKQTNIPFLLIPQATPLAKLTSVEKLKNQDPKEIPMTMQMMGKRQHYIVNIAGDEEIYHLGLQQHDESLFH